MLGYSEEDRQLEELFFHDSDVVITSLVGNTKIEKIPNVRFSEGAVRVFLTLA
jgi:hypothetical protein